MHIRIWKGARFLINRGRESNLEPPRSPFHVCSLGKTPSILTLNLIVLLILSGHSGMIHQKAQSQVFALLASFFRAISMLTKFSQSSTQNKCFCPLLIFMLKLITGCSPGQAKHISFIRHQKCPCVCILASRGPIPGPVESSWVFVRQYLGHISFCCCLLCQTRGQRSCIQSKAMNIEMPANSHFKPQKENKTRDVPILCIETCEQNTIVPVLLPCFIKHA